MSAKIIADTTQGFTAYGSIWVEEPPQKRYIDVGNGAYFYHLAFPWTYYSFGMAPTGPPADMSTQYSVGTAGMYFAHQSLVGHPKVVPFPAPLPAIQRNGYFCGVNGMAKNPLEAIRLFLINAHSSSHHWGWTYIDYAQQSRSCHDLHDALGVAPFDLLKCLDLWEKMGKFPPIKSKHKWSKTPARYNAHLYNLPTLLEKPIAIFEDVVV